MADRADDTPSDVHRLTGSSPGTGGSPFFRPVATAAGEPALDDGSSLRALCRRAHAAAARERQAWRRASTREEVDVAGKLRNDTVALSIELAALRCVGPAELAAKAEALLNVLGDDRDEWGGEVPFHAALLKSTLDDAVRIGASSWSDAARLGQAVPARSAIADLTAQWIPLAAEDHRLADIVNDIVPGAPGHDEIFERSTSAAAANIAVLNRIMALRSTSPDVLALKAAAVLAEIRGPDQLDQVITEHDDFYSSLALSLVRDVIDLLGEPVWTIAGAVRPRECTLPASVANASPGAGKSVMDIAPLDLPSLAAVEGPGFAALASILADARRLSDALDVVEIEAEERTDFPPSPEALFQRPTDASTLTERGMSFVDGRRWYGPSAVDALRAKTFDGPHADDGGSDRRRRDEIVGAYEEWDATNAAANAASGLGVARMASESQAKVFCLLRDALLDRPARTLDGLLVKIAAFADWYVDPEDSAAAKMVADRAEMLAKRQVPQALTMALAILGDLAAMAEARGVTLAALGSPIPASVDPSPVVVPAERGAA